MMIALVNVANLVSLVLLVWMVTYHSKMVSGPELLFAALGIWLTNVIVFALWYWEIDRGGPDQRICDRHGPPDFLFSQQTVPGCAPFEWTPSSLIIFIWHLRTLRRSALLMLCH